MRTIGVAMNKKRPSQKKHSPKNPASVVGALPSGACPACGRQMVEKRATLRLPVNGEEIAVPLVAHLRCPRCGEIVLRFQDSKRFGQDAIAIYRARHGLLSADEIRDIRKRCGLTQGALAGLLSLGANTISRWESGRNVQNRSMDLLLRLIRDLPGSIAYLRRHAA